MITTDACTKNVKAVIKDIMDNKSCYETDKVCIVAIPPDAICYKCSGIAMRREIDKKGNRTGKYLCISCYGQVLCIRNR
jgi:hypothetical protein